MRFGLSRDANRLQPKPQCQGAIRARLFNGIVRHRVSWVQEADEPTALAVGRRMVVVEGIEIEERLAIPS